MKKILLPLLSVMLFPLTASAQYIEQHEKSSVANAPLSVYADNKCELFNADWKFQLGNPAGAECVDYDDSAWRKLDLPHDYQFEQPWDEKADKGRGFKPMCEGWYRKSFNIPVELKDRRIVLDFEGVMYVSDVYVPNAPWRRCAIIRSTTFPTRIRPE